MKQKLMAVAVAGAFALPGAALAQVTLSGKFGVSLSSTKINNQNAARAAGVNTSSMSLHDNTSIIRFAAQESLGGGLTAFGQYELRPLVDGSAPVANALNVGSVNGVHFVGLRSNAWGQVRAGAMETWGGVGTGFSPGAGAQFSQSGIMNYVQLGGTSFSFSSSRQRNVVNYTTPDWKNGFKLGVSWSSAPLTEDNDHLNTFRKGRAWYLLPEFAFGGWKIGYAHANIKDEVAATATNPVDLKADKLYVETSFAGFDVGLTWAKIKAHHGATGGGVAAGTQSVDVKKWLLPIRYRAGNNTFGFQYGKSQDDRVQAGDQSAKYMALAYAYNFSRRTNVSLTWAKMDNNSGAAFDLSSASSSSYGAAGWSALAGEDQSVIAVSLNHTF